MAAGRVRSGRLLAVAGATAALVAAVASAPTLLARATAADAPTRSPAALLAAARASGDVPRSGLAESRGSLGLPDLPAASGLAGLLGGTTTTREWRAGPGRWRVDQLTAGGEVGTYADDSSGQVVVRTWDYGQDEVTIVLGDDGLRLPRAEDLLPPQLAGRLLAAVGPADRASPLPDTVVAGRLAAGVQVVPGDRRSTIGRLQLWLDRASGLPLEVRVLDRTGAEALLARYRTIALGAPAARLLTAPAPLSARYDTRPRSDLLASATALADRWQLPGSLAGLPRAASPVAGATLYGSGLTRVAVLPLPRTTSRDVVRSAVAAGAPQVSGAGGQGVVITSTLLQAVVVRGDDRERAWLVAGLVDTDLLEQAGRALLADPPPRTPGDPS